MQSNDTAECNGGGSRWIIGKEEMIEKIESLRPNKTPDAIESLLLSGKIGKIRIDGDGYQRIKGVQLSWLTVEAHKPGFIEWMRMHSHKYVVHHKDGNPLNNIFSNLQVMTRSEHVSMHRIAYNADPMNAEDIKVSHEAQGKAESKTKRKSWIDLKAFKKFFTIGEYAKVSRVSYDTAYNRLTLLLCDNQITCEKMLISERQCNIYRRTS